MRLISFLHRPRKRPFGVSVIIFALILNVLFLGIAFFTSLQVPIEETAFWILKINDPAIILAYFLAVILFNAFIAVGLWRLQRFAWVLIMIQVGLDMLLDLWGHFNGHSSYITMLINVIIVFYLNQREVQRAFSGSQGEVDGRLGVASKV